ncbi:hypothetical protein MY8738_002739 [Beauveria namnaoensis]
MPRPRQEPINLLNMPLEVQLQIYDYALSDPDLWDRRHCPGCDLCPLTQQEMNQPPFMWHRVVVDAVPKAGKGEQVALSSIHGLPKAFSLAKTWTACDCGKRRGIHLLRTNRHIFSVAAHMLWSRGSFCFFDAIEFAACVEATSPGTRALIRGVSIMSLSNGIALDSHVCLRSQGDNGLDRPSAVYPWEDRCLPEFWLSLQLLPRLKQLSIPERYLNVFHTITDDLFFKTKAYLARLGYMYWTHLSLIPRDVGLYRGYFHGPDNFWAAFFSGRTLASLYGFFERVDTTTWLDGIPNLHPRDALDHRVNLILSQNLAGRTIQATRMQAMEWDSTTIAGKHWLRPQTRVIAAGGTTTVSLDDTGTLKVVVTFYNAPLSRDACVNSNLALANCRAELERLGRRLEAGQRKRRLAREEMIRHFEALLPHDIYTLRKIEGGLRVPKPIVEPPPPPTKRVRTKKNRRGYQKRGNWQE